RPRWQCRARRLLDVPDLPTRPTSLWWSDENAKAPSMRDCANRLHFSHRRLLPRLFGRRLEQGLETFEFLRLDELQRKAHFQMPDNAAHKPPQRHRHTQFGPEMGGDRSAGARHVDDEAGALLAVGQHDDAAWIARQNAAVLALVRHLGMDMPLLPVDLGGKLLALAIGQLQVRDEAGCEAPRYVAA